MGNQQVSLPQNAKQIPDFSNYYVTPCSRLFSLARGVVKELLAPYDKACKYRRQAGMRDDKGNKRSMLLHRLVAITHLPKCVDGRYEVNHVDGNKLNNNVENLEWVTRGENLKHAYSLSLISVSGEKNPKAVLNEGQVLEIYGKLLDGCEVKELSQIYGVCTNVITCIKKKETWNYLLKDLPEITVNFKSKSLEREIVENICQMFSNGCSSKEVFDYFDGAVTKHQINDLKRRRGFKDITSKYLW